MKFVTGLIKLFSLSQKYWRSIIEPDKHMCVHPRTRNRSFYIQDKKELHHGRRKEWIRRENYPIWHVYTITTDLVKLTILHTTNMLQQIKFNWAIPCTSCGFQNWGFNTCKKKLQKIKSCRTSAGEIQRVNCRAKIFWIDIYGNNVKAFTEK